MSRDMLIMVYKALVQSIVQYGIIGWGGTNTTNLLPLLSMQKQILKVMLKKSIYCPSNEIFDIAKVLDVKQIYIKTLLLHVVTRAEQYSLSNNISLLETRSKRSSIFTIPRKKKLIGQQHADYWAPKLFNVLPFSMQRSCSVFIFKHLVNEWLLASGRQYSFSLFTQ